MLIGQSEEPKLGSQLKLGSQPAWPSRPPEGEGLNLSYLYVYALRPIRSAQAQARQPAPPDRPDFQKGGGLNLSYLCIYAHRPIRGAQAREKLEVRGHDRPRQ